LQGTVAYIPQIPWIQNATVRNNILFGEKFESDYYKKVVKACALIQDFSLLPGEDFTEIGEKVITC
jgi:ABC-type multidrug transport system fused ATPase/permease subunit